MLLPDKEEGGLGEVPSLSDENARAHAKMLSLPVSMTAFVAEIVHQTSGHQDMMIANGFM